MARVTRARRRVIPCLPDTARAAALGDLQDGIQIHGRATPVPGADPLRTARDHAFNALAVRCCERTPLLRPGAVVSISDHAEVRVEPRPDPDRPEDQAMLSLGALEKPHF